MNISQFRGCLLGLAIGDAFGAPVEFDSLSAIKLKHGAQGITELKPWGGFPAGFYTDDTQMTIATVEGMLAAHERWRTKGIAHPPSMVYQAYLAWLKTQDEPAQRRAPGNTCLSALSSGRMGTLKEPINNSKGCGGVMRTAPVGLLFPPGAAFEQGAEYAAITHGHPSGYLSAGYISEMIAHIIGGAGLEDAIIRATELLITYEGHQETLARVEQAVQSHREDRPVEAAILGLGEGWVGEEALGIALFCALRFADDFGAGVIAAANHDGDTDSTASITGAILGTLLGVEAISQAWIETVENRAMLEQLAQRLFEVRSRSSLTD
jgi:ADP-ribosylglycohydrolase